MNNYRVMPLLAALATFSGFAFVSPAQANTVITIVTVDGSCPFGKPASYCGDTGPSGGWTANRRRCMGEAGLPVPNLKRCNGGRIVTWLSSP